MKSPKFVHVWSKKIGLARTSIGRLAGAIDEALNSSSLDVNVLTMFGYLSAKLFNSHGSLVTSNKHGLVSGLHLFVSLSEHVTVAPLRNSLQLNS